MAGSIYIATSEAQSGKSLITLGLIELALHKTSKARIFSPIILQRGSAVQRDDHLDQIFSHFNLNLDFKDCFVFTRDETADLVGHKKIDELIEIVISRYKHVEDQCDFVLNENTDFLGESVAIEFDMKTAVAFGIEPHVALLSYSSGASDKGEEVEKVWEATGLIFPDFNTSNNPYKPVQLESGTVAIGPVLQGLSKPVNELSSGCTVEDIVNTVIITAIQSQKYSLRKS